MNTSFPYHYCHFHVISVALMSITIVSETTMILFMNLQKLQLCKKHPAFRFNHKNETSKTSETAGADTGFSVGGGADPQGAPTYDFVKISEEKLHEIEKILDRRGARPGDIPLRSVTAYNFSPISKTLTLKFIHRSRNQLNVKF